MCAKAVKIISTGIIGYGLSGKNIHTPLLLANPSFALKAVATKSSYQRQCLPDDTIQLTPEQLIVDPSIDLVIVATPNDSHYSYAKKALKAGKHVIVEKTIALNVEHILDLIEIAHARGLLLSVFHNRLRDCDYLAIKKLVTDEILGTIHSYTANVNSYWPDVINNWRDNPEYGGAVWELAPSLIVQALSLFGRPTSIFADISTLRKSGKAPDNFYMRLIYSNLIVELRCNALLRHTGPRYSIYGNIASYFKNGTDPQYRQLKNGMIPTDLKYGKESVNDWGAIYACTENESEEMLYPSPVGDYPGFYRHIYLSITQKDGLKLIDHQWALDTVSIIAAAHQSSQHQKVIKLS